MPYRRVPLKTRKRAARLYDMGLSSTQVGKIVDCSGRSVLRYAEIYGTGKRDAREANAVRYDTKERRLLTREMGYYYMKVRSAAVVAEHFGVHESTVRRRLRSDENPYLYPLTPNEEIPYAV